MNDATNTYTSEPTMTKTIDHKNDIRTARRALRAYAADFGPKVPTRAMKIVNAAYEVAREAGIAKGTVCL